MRFFFAALGGLLLIGCGDQSASEPCERTLEIESVGNVLRGTTVTMRASVEEQAGNCSNDRRLSWSSSRINIAEITQTTDSTATVRALSPGLTNIKAWLTYDSSVRDSVDLGVVPPVDE